jgi:glycosyltransferase involved in cell wall biosynthesis
MPGNRVKVVVVHNFYQQPGGEDQVFADETALLESHGHTVIRHTLHNDAIDGMSKLTVAGKTIWNSAARAQLRDLVNRERPRVVHFHNTFPLFSPSVYSAARSAGAAVVQTLHNYRLICPDAQFFRDGRPCEDCLGKMIPWPAVMHRCYRDSLDASAVAAAMLTIHKLRGTYHHEIDAYIALSEFARTKFIAAGLPARKIMVKPNFVGPDPGVIPDSGAGGYALFVGRLDQSKGIHTLLEAWKRLKAPIELKIAGSGELADAVRAAATKDVRITFLGRRPLREIYDLMADAAVLVFPSVWYECLPKTIIESLAVGTPVIASKLGSMTELISDGRTGTHFIAGDACDLAAAAQRMLENPAKLQQMRVAARAEFEAKYTAEHNYGMLMDIYQAALRIAAFGAHSAA